MKNISLLLILALVLPTSCKRDTKESDDTTVLAETIGFSDNNENSTVLFQFHDKNGIIRTCGVIIVPKDKNITRKLKKIARKKKQVLLRIINNPYPPPQILGIKTTGGKDIWYKN